MKLKRQIIIVSALILILGFSGLAETKAVLGPVHVELNVTGERLGPSRANTVTAFTIYLRLNTYIYFHDWVKIWFPIDEASCDPTDICGEPFEIKGHNESPRFVPNEKYFEKYDNPEEKDVGKLYEVLDEYFIAANFYDCESCKKIEDSCRIIQDPSGLGCWITGTVLPALPRDEIKLREYLIDRSIRTNPIMIGNNPCECDYSPVDRLFCPCIIPKYIQTHKESSVCFESDATIEAWRQGYNPVELNVCKSAGVIAPATPGRYRIRVATRGEPTPVESASFVLPCSEITNFNAKINPQNTATETKVTLDFDTGEGGALDAGNSLITIIFPEEFTLPLKIKSSDIKVNGVPLKTNPQISQEENRITIVSSSNVENLGHATIEFENGAGIISPPKEGKYKFGIYTSSEPEIVECFVDTHSPNHKLWEDIPGSVRKRILQYEKLPIAGYQFDADKATINENEQFQKLYDSILWVTWGTRPEIHQNFSRIPFSWLQPVDVDYLLAYNKKGDESPMAFLGPDCCHYEPGFSADDHFDPRKAVTYPGFGTIYPYCDVMIKSWRRCSKIQSLTAEIGTDYMMVIVGGDQCAAVGCKSFREERDVYFLFIPSIELETEYGKTFARFSEIYPVEFKAMLPKESSKYTNIAGSIFLFEHNWEEDSFDISVGSTPGNFDLHSELSMNIPDWCEWLVYVFHMKRNGR
jgi:hypothetical protein